MTVLLAGAGLTLSWFTPWAWLPVGLVWLWGLSFFRDPARDVPRRPDVLYAPADGRVTEVTSLPSCVQHPGPCVRVRIFLSIFNVHVNRMPCAAVVDSVTPRPGGYLNAMNPRSADENESNTLVLSPQQPWSGPVVVRQISGLIARTIVCRARSGDRLASGERFGMIKFGSGTELIVPQQSGLRVLVREGQAVRAGLTPMAELSEKSPS
jgi:phosphatidylserine decarboxylase